MHPSNLSEQWWELRFFALALTLQIIELELKTKFRLKCNVSESVPSADCVCNCYFAIYHIKNMHVGEICTVSRLHCNKTLPCF